MATATASNVAPAGSEQKLNRPEESAAICRKIVSPVESVFSNTTRTVPPTTAAPVRESTILPLIPVILVLTWPVHRLQPVIAVSLPQNRCARVEINIQVHVLPGVHHNRPADHLSGRNLDAGIGLAGKLQLENAAIMEHYAIESLAAARLTRWSCPAASIVRNQQQANLLIRSRGQRGVRTKICQQTGMRSRRKQIDLHRL